MHRCFVFLNDFIASDFWKFLRPFVYGGVGGFSLFLMNYLEYRKKKTMRYFNFFISEYEKVEVENNKENIEEKIKLIFDVIERKEKKYYLGAAIVYFFVSGISGMVAVNAFNSTANELQAFSIAVLAGLGGFAFLKRSALVDDEDSEILLHGFAEKIVMENENSIYENYLKNTLIQDSSADSCNDDKMHEENDHKLKDDVKEEDIKSFVKWLVREFDLEEREIDLIYSWHSKGLSEADIVNRLLEYLDN